MTKLRKTNIMFPLNYKLYIKTEKQFIHTHTHICACVHAHTRMRTHTQWKLGEGRWLIGEGKKGNWKGEDDGRVKISKYMISLKETVFMKFSMMCSAYIPAKNFCKENHIMQITKLWLAWCWQWLSITLDLDIRQGKNSYLFFSLSGKLPSQQKAQGFNFLVN